MNSTRKAEVSILAVTLAFISFASCVPHKTNESTPHDLTHDELVTLIESANTPTDHQKLAEYYQRQASARLRLSKEHQELVDAYAQILKGNPSALAVIQEASKHCGDLAELYSKAADDAQTLAQMHLKMAERFGAH